MMRRLILGLVLAGLAACVAPADRDGGIGGTGAPEVREAAV